MEAEGEIIRHPRRMEAILLSKNIMETTEEGDEHHRRGEEECHQVEVAQCKDLQRQMV